MFLFARPKKPGPLKPTPNPYPSRIYHWKQKVGIATFLFLLLGGGTLRFYKPFYELFQESLFESVAWVQGVFTQPFQETEALFKESYTFTHLKEEHARLVHENEALKWQLQTLEPLIYENASLKQNLNVPSFESYGHLTARVLSNPYDGLHHFYLIAAGKKQGLEKDQVIVAPEGVLGRLEKVGNHVARVLLLNDINSKIPVVMLPSKQKAILAGDGSFLPILVYVEDVRKIQKGEKVVTSGLGGVFPSGLPVGVVDEIVNGNIQVRPFASFQKIGWVHALQIPSKEALEETKTGLEE